MDVHPSIKQGNTPSGPKFEGAVILIRNSTRAALAAIATITTLAASYQAFVSSDVFISESRFLLRSADQTAQPSLGAIFKGLGGTGAEGPLMVKDYLLSRAVLGELEASTSIRDGYRQGDLVNRFPALFQPDTTEEFFEYYRQHIKLEVDPQSSVAVLTVRAFDPNLAQAVNTRMLVLAETAVSNINRRMDEDAVELANAEVAEAEQRVVNSETALAKFRVGSQMFDPERQAAGEFQMLAELQRILINVEARQAQVRRLAPESPQLNALDAQAISVRDAIARTRTQATSGDSKSLTVNSPAYQRILLEREIAAKQLAVTTEGLLRAKAEARRKHFYLERLASPSRPDSPLEPTRLRNVLATLLVGVLAWGVVALVLAGIREHSEAA